MILIVHSNELCRHSRSWPPQSRSTQNTARLGLRRRHDPATRAAIPIEIINVYRNVIDTAEWPYKNEKYVVN